MDQSFPTYVNELLWHDDRNGEDNMEESTQHVLSKEKLSTFLL